MDQIQATDKDLLPKCWAKSRNSGQPCEKHLLGAGASSVNRGSSGASSVASLDDIPDHPYTTINTIGLTKCLAVVAALDTIRKPGVKGTELRS
jgi:hypothetical protein